MLIIIKSKKLLFRERKAKREAQELADEPDEILGTPSQALGSGTIRSLVPSRASRMKKSTVASSSTLLPSVQERPFYNPGEKDLDSFQTPDVFIPPPRRQKALYKGTYFPCFGLFCSPLAGTEIFPLPPKMEKVHFDVAMDQPTDHMDGEPKYDYLDDIKKYMEPILASYKNPNKDRFLYRYANDMENDWKHKFPYASHRFGEYPHVKRDVKDSEQFQGFYNRPDMFENYVDRLTGVNKGRHGMGSKLSHEQLPVQQSVQAQESTQRQLAAKASEIKTLTSDEFGEHIGYGPIFTKFLALNRRFAEKGHKLVKNVERLPLHQIQLMTSYEQFEDWIFQPKGSIQSPNMVHEKLLFVDPWDQQFTVTQKIKVAGWLSTLFKFDRIKLIASKVRIVLTLYKLINTKK